MVSESSSHSKLKRQRISRELVPDRDLWLEDGNIVIAVTDDTSEEKTTYAFKCHRSVLAKQSRVFEGLFGIPASENSEDVYEGLPLVMLPDAYADVKGLLHYIYEPG